MDAEEDGAGLSVVVVESDSAGPSIRNSECNVTRAHALMSMSASPAYASGMDAEEDGAGPSVVVVENDSAGPSATVREVRNMVVRVNAVEGYRRT